MNLKTSCFKVTLLAIILVFAIFNSVSANIIYVDGSANGLATGNSWGNAFTNLQPAIYSASPNDEIWVAKGTYRPSNDREVAYDLKNGVDLYGGFLGNETNRDQRDPALNLTVLSGELGNPNDPTDNSRHIIWVKDFSVAMVIDGFHLVAGYANNSSGGAFYSHFSTIELRRCVFKDNFGEWGGAICSSTDDELLFVDCRFENNIGTWGGAFQAWSVKLDRFRNCVFIGNTASNVGGGLAIQGSSNIVLENCKIFENSADKGGGIILEKHSVLRCTNAIINGNSASAAAGGGIKVNDSAQLFLYNSTIIQNSSSNAGGGIHTSTLGDASLNNSIIWGNTGTGTNANIAGSPASYLVNHCLLETPFPGPGNIVANPMFIDKDGLDNIAGNEDDDLHLSPSSLAIDSGNVAYALADLWDLNGNGDTMEIYPEDISHNMRVVGFSIDIGPYEYGAPLNLIQDAKANMVLVGPYPNPSHSGETTINIFLPRPQIINLQIHNAQGKVVYRSGPLSFSRGNQTLEVSSEGLAKGYYMISIQAEVEKWIGRWIVL